MPFTGKRKVRFVYSGYADGYRNMATDEAVLIGLQKGISDPILRIYKWDPPTISIGYFQKHSDIDFEKCSEDGIMVVRRLTGGRAVLHDIELTYSILFTDVDFTPFKKKEIFEYIARALTESLHLLGIDAKMAEKSRGDLKSPNCFASPAQYEIETKGKQKLIGSAQVIKKNVVLQHGAIPLTTAYSRIDKYLTKDSQKKKSATSLSTWANKEIKDEELLKALRNGFSGYFPLIEGKLTEYELKLTDELVKNKYSKDEWNKMK